MDNGNVITEAFCATCGSPIYVCSTGGSTRIPLKAGSFDAPTAVWASTQIWTRSAVTWHDTSLATEHHVAGVPPMEKSQNRIINKQPAPSGDSAGALSRTFGGSQALENRR
jgi:hypothetical protein